MYALCVFVVGYACLTAYVWCVVCVSVCERCVGWCVRYVCLSGCEVCTCV